MRRIFVLIGFALGLTLMLTCSQQPPQPAVDPANLEELDEWHAARIERLTNEAGWLTVVGLHWIEEGESSFGTDSSNTIVLPEGAGVAFAGSIYLDQGELRVEANNTVPLKLNDNPVTEAAIVSDADGPPDVLTLNGITFYVIQRRDRSAVRVKDPNSEGRLHFTGIDRFPATEAFKIEADFVAYDPPQEREIPTVIGTPADYLVPGVVRFEVDGIACELEPVVAAPDSPVLFFIFGDATNGVETYGAGRFMYSDREADGKVTLDFNKAVNPPCAFTAYATCPLPTPENRLAVRIEAGEKNYGDH